MVLHNVTRMYAVSKRYYYRHHSRPPIDKRTRASRIERGAYAIYYYYNNDVVLAGAGRPMTKHVRSARRGGEERIIKISLLFLIYYYYKYK